MQSGLAEILSDLESLSSESSFKRKFEQSFAALGFDTYTYVGLDTEELEEAKRAESVSNVIYLTNLKAEWVSHYVEEDYGSVDPIIKDCTTNRLPIRWNEHYRANARSREENRVMEDAWENGLKRGLTIPVHGPGGELGIFSLNSQLSDKEFLRLSEGTKYNAQVLAYHFHDAVQRTLRPAREIPMPIPLTEREVEILRWTVSGKTAWEIGGILKISERTVNFHIQNVMEKFGVHNKTHAAAKAMGLGLLNL